MSRPAQQTALVALLVVVAGGVGSVWVSVRDISQGVQALRGARVDEPVTLEQPELTSQTVEYEKTLNDGTIIRFTCPRNVGEDFDRWKARCRKEWKAICEENEG